MKTNNRGYSLVELLVAFALLAIISTMMVGFISSGSRLYRSVSAEVGLQMNTQLAMAQLKDYLIDCNGGIATETAGDTTMLYVLNRETIEDEEYAVLHVFRFEAAENSLYYGRGESSLSGGSISLTVVAEDLLAHDVTELSVSFGNISGTAAGVLDLTADFESRSKNYNITQTVSLRNKPHYTVGGPASLIDLVF